MSDELNRRATLTGLTGLATLVSASAPAGRPAPPVAPLSRDEMVSVTDFGAVADGKTDNVAAFERAIDRGVALGRPILIPGARGSYGISRTVHPLTGIVGHGPSSVIQALSPTGFSDGSALVRIGWTQREDATPCTVPVQHFTVRGAATRTPRRHFDPATIGFAGTGILYDETTIRIHAIGVGAHFCRKGIVHGNDSGHLGGTGIHCHNNWYNLYWERNSGDFRYFDCDFTGAQFAGYGCHGSNKGFTAPGGITGLTLVGCHAGFAPFGFFQEDGDGTVGLATLVTISSSFEQIGNQAIRLGTPGKGQHRFSRDWTMIAIGHSWSTPGGAEHDAYAIQDDPRAPQQTYAVDCDAMQGPPITIIGTGWTPGRSGYHTRIGDLLAWVRDANGIGGYDIPGQGRERLVYDSAPSLRMAADVVRTGQHGADWTLAGFELPPSYDNTPWATVAWTLAYENRGTRPVAVRIGAVATNGDPNERRSPPQWCQPGRGNLSGTVQVGAGRRDRARNRHHVDIRCRPEGDGGAALTLEGSVTLTVAQDTGVVG